MAKYRRIKFLAKYQDLEWLAKKACPSCSIKGRLIFGLHPKEKIRCLHCGYIFTIKGRKVAS